MHQVDRATPWEAIWQAMEQLVQQGKVSYIGSSSFAGWDVATTQPAATAIVGPTTTAQLNADLSTLSTHLDPATLQALDWIWSGPGEAPQAYAW